MSGGLTLVPVLMALALAFEGVSAFSELKAFWLGFLAIAIVGLIDDLRGLSPLSKLVWQIVSCSLTLAFLVLELRIPSDPVTLGCFLLWLVAVVNAVNLLDNMDGLAGGVGAIAALSVGFLILSPGMPGRLLTVLMAAVLLGFLAHNFSPARIFLGDTGSHVLGFTLACLPLYTLNSVYSDWRQWAALVMILLVPIADMILVTLRRTLEMRPFYVGGKDHTSHWLLSHGLGERQVATVFYAAAACCSVAAGFLVRWP